MASDGKFFVTANYTAQALNTASMTLLPGSFIQYPTTGFTLTELTVGGANDTLVEEFRFEPQVVSATVSPLSAQGAIAYIPITVGIFMYNGSLYRKVRTYMYGTQPTLVKRPKNLIVPNGCSLWMGLYGGFANAWLSAFASDA